MSIWFKRHFGFQPYTETFDLFEKTFMGMAGPREMLLVSDMEPKISLYMRLPSEQLGRLFDGFERCSLADVPKTFGILIGHQDEFDKLRRLLND